MRLQVESTAFEEGQLIFEDGLDQKLNAQPKKISDALKKKKNRGAAITQTDSDVEECDRGVKAPSGGFRSFNHV